MAPRPPETEESFADLRRLLTIKRHEVPPPGYFAGFSGKVMARIEGGESLQALSWWQRMLSGLAARPSLAGGMAVVLAVGLLSVMGQSPVSHSTSQDADVLLSFVPVAVQVAWVDRDVELASRDSLSRELSSLGSSSVAPVMVGRDSDPLGRLLHKANYSPGF